MRNVKKYLLRTFVLFGFIALSPVLAFASESNAKVRVLHASPDAPAVDVLVDNNKVVSSLSFNNVTGYLDLPGGSYNVKVRPAGSSGPDVIDTTLDVKSGRSYTVAAINKLAQIEPLVLQDQNRLKDMDKARVRAVHLSPNAPAVDIALKNGAVVFSGLEYKEASNYLRLNPGTYDLEIRVAGTHQVVLDIPQFKIEAGKVYQVYALGLVGETPQLGVQVSVDDAVERQYRIHRLDRDRNINWRKLNYLYNYDRK